MAITVNGVEIDERAINVESAFHDAPDPAEAQYKAAHALVIRELLRQRLGTLGLRKERERVEETAVRDAEVDALLERELAVPEADEAACRRYFNMNARHFRTPDLFEVRHILIAVAPDDEEGRLKARDRAEALIAQLRDDSESFPGLARIHSDCPSKDDGGRLGQIGKGQTVPEFEAALEHLPEGLAARPVETRYGYHVVWIDRRIHGRALSFEQVKPTIARYLEESSRRRAISQYIRRLAGEAEIVGIEFDGEASPLVQ